MTTADDMTTANPSVWAVAVERQEAWGPPAETATKELNRRVRDLEADLVGLVDDIRRGPLGRWREEASAFLLELRREFLRHHRRLVVNARKEDEADDDTSEAAAAEWLRTELAELAERFRAVALSRSSRLTHGGWLPAEIVGAIDRTVAGLPAEVLADYEPSSYEDPSDQSSVRWVGRRFLRLGRWFRRLTGEDPKQRIVPMRALADHHLASVAPEKVEGLAAVFLQSEGQLATRTRMILEGIVRSYDVLVEHVGDGDIPSLLGTLRTQVEDEFALAEAELNRIVDEGARRATSLLSDGFRALKEDIGVIGTLDLPARRRRPRRRRKQRDHQLELLEQQLVRTRENAAGQYVLLALHLEFVGFKARAKVRLDERLVELAHDVRGRSYVQIQRVLAVLDEAIEIVKSEEAEGELGTCLEPVERVATEAQRSAHLLLDQFSADQTAAPILEALNREANALTDRYRVPAGKLPFAEFRLPPPVVDVEVPFANVVAAYVQTDVAPKLIAVASEADEKIRPLLMALEELENVVTFGAEQFDDEAAYREPETTDLRGPEQLRGVIGGSLCRSRDALAEQLESAETWGDEIAGAMRDAVLSQLLRLRDRLGEGDIHRAKLEPKSKKLDRQLARVGDLLGRFQEEGSRRVRSVVGDERLAELREELGLLGDEDDADLSLLARPEKSDDVPVYYRRLFSPQAHWAGDLLDTHGPEVRRLRNALSGEHGALRTAAVVGVEGVGRGAFVAAAARNEKWTQVKRAAFTRPVEVKDVEALLEDLPRGSLVVVSGLPWTFRAKPGGFAPLRRLLQGIIENKSRVAWLLEIDALAWRFASQGTSLADVFAETVHIEPLDAEALASAILARHQLSGHEIHFGHDAPGDRERFFASLHAASGGLLQVALTYWVASIARFDEHNGVVRMGEPPPSPMDALKHLPDDVVLAIYAIARQGWMNAETFASLFSIPHAAAEGRLSKLAGLGLLERAPGNALVVRRHLRGAVERMLEEGEWTA